MIKYKFLVHKFIHTYKSTCREKFDNRLIQWLHNEVRISHVKMLSFSVCSINFEIYTYSAIHFSYSQGQVFTLNLFIQQIPAMYWWSGRKVKRATVTVTKTDNQLYSITGLLCSYTKSTTGFDFIRCAFLLGFLSVGSMFIILGLTVEHQTVGEVFFFPLCNFFFFL